MEPVCNKDSNEIIRNFKEACKKRLIICNFPVSRDKEAGLFSCY